MKRRDSLRILISTSAGFIALPSWARAWSANDVNTFRTSFLLEEQTALAAVVDTIIPASNAIGALSVGVDKFMLKLIDDCYEKEIQQKVKLQLAKLDTAANNQYVKSFSTCDQQQREEMLLKFSTSEDKAENDFFKLMKSETIRGFSTSKEVMVNYLKYQQVPGHFYGCVDIKA
jgi:hypothetical protein